MTTKAEVKAALHDHAERLDETASGWDKRRFEVQIAAVEEASAILRDAEAEMGVKPKASVR